MVGELHRIRGRGSLGPVEQVGAGGSALVGAGPCRGLAGLASARVALAHHVENHPGPSQLWRAARVFPDIWANDVGGRMVRLESKAVAGFEQSLAARGESVSYP